MIRVGLTGGIAAGKSIAAARLRELGAYVIDHDRLARESVAPGSAGLSAIVQRFGPGVLAADGTLDRAALASIVFGDEAALTDLNAIVHPRVHDLAAAYEQAAAGDGNAGVIVHDIPLLIETGQAGDFDVLVVVHAPADQRITRLVENRGMSLPEARKRVASQVDDAVRLADADEVLDGTGQPDNLRAQVDALWEKLQKRHEA
ncbi:hypothetical protein GCM10010401_23390 [Rarobacter faecitabidus]|uniref:Dephospho-CoA kinase n=1 Tax=Rarobacter faecitabidus TaxID=13243 RepID=A0A542ZVX0_RARFA|nr:dephospho-CoA kinase [Rarobacter faecitabidus]TQL64517.1 dephospho-CoA kinase [Rarobacter faecitabidus]